MRVERLRRWLAKKLYPDAFRNAERYYFLYHRVDELKHWCGYDSPDIREAAEWLQKSDHVHWMPLTDFQAAIARRDHEAVRVSSIDQFREKLRQRKAEGAA